MVKLITIYIMSGFYVWIGIKHFLNPIDPFMHIMPPYLPFHLELVYLSGAFEIIFGLSLLYKGTRTMAAWGLILLLIAVFPANIYLAFNEQPQQLISLQFEPPISLFTDL